MAAVVDSQPVRSPEPHGHSNEGSGTGGYFPNGINNSHRAQQATQSTLEPVGPVAGAIVLDAPAAEQSNHPNDLNRSNGPEINDGDIPGSQEPPTEAEGQPVGSTPDEPLANGQGTPQSRSRSGSVDSNDSRHVRLEIRGRREGVQMPVIIRQNEPEPIPVPEGSAEQPDAQVNDTEEKPFHPIQWEADVYDSARGVSTYFTDCPVVKYLDHTSLEDAKVEYERSKLTTKKKGDEDDEVEWKASVFHIRYALDAHMPWLDCEYSERDSNLPPSPYDCPTCAARKKNGTGTGKNAARIYNQDRVPKTLKEHDIQHWSKPALILKSPHLYQELRELVDHYPAYFPKLTTTNITKDWEYPILYPYFILLHFFEKIEESLAREITTTGDTAEEEDKRPAGIKEVSTPFKKSPRVARRHLQILFDYIKPMYDAKVFDYKKSLAEGTAMWHFEALGYLLRPGTVVYVKDRWTPWYLAVVDVATLQQKGAIGNVTLQWAMSVWVLSSDGSRVARCLVPDVIIHQYDGAKNVTTELDMCPADLWDKVHGLQRHDQAVDRGRLLYKALQKGYLVAQYTADERAGEAGYAGKVVVDHRRGQDMIRGLQLKKIGLVTSDKDKYEHYDGVFVHKPWSWGPQHSILNEDNANGSNAIDPDPYGDPGRGSRYAPPESRRSIVVRRTIPLVAEEVTSASYKNNLPDWTAEQDEKAMKTLEDEHLRLIYPLTFAFSLKAKKWIELDASRLEEVKKSDRSYKSLVLSDKSKQMIEAIVRRLEKGDSETTWSADFVAGKGSGGIILLHGPPGVGKTFTVEAIAERLDSPLLSLTVADIGTKETMIERELLKWFTWAEMWKAVLLIDEADIFLERRHTRDLTRNGLVSAFLRRAEYFDGLLFLTTNRVGQIDDAFISRIQVPIRYEKLDGPQLAKIWESFFKKLKDEMNQLQSRRKKEATIAARIAAENTDNPDHKPLPGSTTTSTTPATKPRQIVVSQSARKYVLDQFRKGEFPGLNGRDIRNAFQAAITLAEYDAYTAREAATSAGDKPGSGDDDEDEDNDVVVEDNHFADVLDMSCNFRKYINKIRRDDEHLRAHLRGDRANDNVLDEDDDGAATGRNSPEGSYLGRSMGRVSSGGGGGRGGR